VKTIAIVLFFLVNTFSRSLAQQLYQLPPNVTSALSSFENPNALKGAGGKSNKTAKGHAFEMMKPGETKVLLDAKGAGMIQRIWLTVNQNPVMLRSLRLRMYWDGASQAAVDVPLGDFFGANLGRQVAYQSALFSTAEGRSFNCIIPMPFKAGAKIIITNDGTEFCKLYYDVDFIRTPTMDPAALYFHAAWSRQRNLKPGDDINILEKINGSGRFIGMSAALHTDSLYGKTWWGEGEVKMFIDGDSAYATIVGTGAEDYVGSGWGLGTFQHLYQGCTVADTEKGQFSFYRLHVPDAIYFKKNIRVTLQQIGGGDIEEVKRLITSGVALKPVSIDQSEDGFYPLFDLNKSINDYTKGWVNFYRVDDYAITAYFYLAKPVNNLPPLATIAERIAKH
jgi:Protein of unknown function (DUF2961)